MEQILCKVQKIALKPFCATGVQLASKPQPSTAHTNWHVHSISSQPRSTMSSFLRPTLRHHSCHGGYWVTTHNATSHGKPHNPRTPFTELVVRFSNATWQCRFFQGLVEKGLPPILVYFKEWPEIELKLRNTYLQRGDWLALDICCFFKNEMAPEGRSMKVLKVFASPSSTLFAMLVARTPRSNGNGGIGFEGCRSKHDLLN